MAGGHRHNGGTGTGGLVGGGLALASGRRHHSCTGTAHLVLDLTDGYRHDDGGANLLRGLAALADGHGDDGHGHDADGLGGGDGDFGRCGSGGGLLLGSGGAGAGDLLLV